MINKRMMNKRIKQAGIFFLILLMLGCTPSVKQTQPHHYYTLQYQQSQNKADKPVYGFVKVDLPHISSKHMTENITYAPQPFEKNSYSQSKWKEPLTIIFQEWLVQSIADMNLFKGVIRVSSRANVSLMLETDIVKFEHLLYSNEVNVVLRVILIQYNQRKIIKEKLFNYRIKVTQASAKSAVISFNHALKQFDKELYQWLNQRH